MPRTAVRSRLGAVLVAGIVAAAVAVAILFSARSDAGTTPKGTEILDLFEHNAPVSMADSADLRAAGSDPLLSELVELSEARLVLQEGDQTFLSAPGRGVHTGSVCLVEILPGGGFSNGCNSAESWAQGRPIVKEEPQSDGTVRLIGVVPNAVTVVVVGDRRSAIADNVLDAIASGDADEVRGLDDAGRTVFAVPIGG